MPPFQEVLVIFRDVLAIAISKNQFWSPASSEAILESDFDRALSTQKKKGDTSGNSFRSSGCG
jgi:hypothetical protein